jgi:hypothetical protein
MQVGVVGFGLVVIEKEPVWPWWFDLLGLRRIQRLLSCLWQVVALLERLGHRRTADIHFVAPSRGQLA